MSQVKVSVSFDPLSLRSVRAEIDRVRTSVFRVAKKVIDGLRQERDEMHRRAQHAEAEVERLSETPRRLLRIIRNRDAEARSYREEMLDRERTIRTLLAEEFTGSCEFCERVFPSWSREDAAKHMLACEWHPGYWLAKRVVALASEHRALETEIRRLESLLRQAFDVNTALFGV